MNVEDTDIPYSLGVKKPYEDLNTYAIGDIPEVAAALNNLYQQLVIAEHETLPNPDVLFEPEADEQVVFEILPPSDSETDQTDGSNQDQHDSEYLRDLRFLEELKDGWNYESKIVGCKLASEKAHSKYTYLAVLLMDSEGTVTTVVADTLGKDSAIYVWQRPDDDSRPSEWEEVFSNGRPTARKKGAMRVNHRGSVEDINERVVNLMSMPLVEYEAEYERRRSSSKQASDEPEPTQVNS